MAITMGFNEEDRLRYSRNTMLGMIGQEGQRKLCEASVLIVGCGALGCVSGLYLSASGVCRIGLGYYDTVYLSNLQRQIAYTVDDIGKKKAAALKSKIEASNPNVTVVAHDVFVNKANVDETVEGFDVVVEGSDNPDTKYLVTEVCRKKGIPCVTAGIFGTEAQVMTFVPGHAAYGDFFPESATHGGFTPCSLGGVLGPLPGIVGSIQASEAIKIICGRGECLVDRLLLIDASTMRFDEVRLL